ncbi:uncharacterized protein LOC141894063 [Acropora palmata]|uniref:uncharacterized protein LOC141894063 n=1 Tax=Acropora palmata TaxID=6131 RepID=UPI003DA19AF2
MDQSWLTSTIDYMYKTVSGENDEGKSNSDYQRAFSNGIWVNDLPSNNYEPLESSCLDKRKSSPQEYEREVQQLRRKISSLEASYAVSSIVESLAPFLFLFFSAKNKEVESLKKQLEEHGIKTDLREKDELEQKIKDTQQQLKKAKKRALLAKGNLIKKERELHYLKSITQISQEQQMKLERVIASLQNELHSLRDEMVSLKNVMVLKVEQVTCQLAATNTELADMKEREKKLIENNISIMDETVQLREQFETFKKETLEEIAKGMAHQQFASNTMQTQCKEKGTESVRWVDSSLIEKTNELSQQVEKVKRDIIKEEERINHQHDQLKVFLDTSHDALEVPTVNPIALEQVHEEATIGYSSLQNTDTQKHAAEPRKAQNPYTLKAAAWKGKSGVLNARPLPSNSGVAQVAVPVEVKQFMFNPTETMTTPQPKTIYQNQTEKGTESVKWVDSSLIEKTNELSQQVEKVKRDIIKEEERINHQHDHLKVLLDTAHDALEVPAVNPIALEQVHEEATIGYSSLQNTDTQKDTAEPRKAQNPYTLKAAAWKGKSGVLNARPLPSNSGVAQVAVPVEVKQFMFNPTETMTTPQPKTIYQNQTDNIYRHGHHLSQKTVCKQTPPSQHMVVPGNHREIHTNSIRNCPDTESKGRYLHGRPLPQSGTFDPTAGNLSRRSKLQ